MSAYFGTRNSGSASLGVADFHRSYGDDLHGRAPWQVGEVHDGLGTAYQGIVDANGEVVAIVHAKHALSLIAAAPEIIARAMIALEYLDRMAEKKTANGDVLCAASQLRAAIAKAGAAK